MKKDSWKRKSVRPIGRAAVAAAAALVIGLLVKEGASVSWTSHIHRGLLSVCARLYTPVAESVSDGEKTDYGELFYRAALWLSPMGVYAADAEGLSLAAQDDATLQQILALQAQDENSVDEEGNVTIVDATSDTEEETTAQEETKSETTVDLGKLSDFDYLKSHYYTVDSTTSISSSELDAEEFLSEDMSLSEDADGPQVLIYHTHSQEAFADSKDGEEADTVVGMGDYLTELLTQQYGIQTLHYKGVFDLIDGKLDRSEAYELAKPEITKLLEDNPSIEVVIDLHRDGVPEDTHLTTEIDGKQTAQIMFFNGLSRTNTNGSIGYLSNPYIQDNLAFSFQMKLKAEELYPGFARKIYLKSYRYNMHFKPKTLLIEAGAQTNTVEEERNAMEPLAKILASVLKPAD